MSSPQPNLTPRDTPLQPGDAAPDFTLKNQKIEDWTLSDALKKGDVVLCFYPMDFSPVCSTEMKCVTDEMQKFIDRGAQIVGISTDSFFTHKAWAESLGLTHDILADMHADVCRAYGLHFPELNVAARGTIVVGQDGTVKWSQGRELGAAMNNDEVLASIS
ncbi:MAG: redoxin domain-containing protein [Planctomycetota bacterium]